MTNPPRRPQRIVPRRLPVALTTRRVIGGPARRTGPYPRWSAPWRSPAPSTSSSAAGRRSGACGRRGGSRRAWSSSVPTACLGSTSRAATSARCGWKVRVACAVVRGARRIGISPRASAHAAVASRRRRSDHTAASACLETGPHNNHLCRMHNPCPVSTHIHPLFRSKLTSTPCRVRPAARAASVLFLVM